MVYFLNVPCKNGDSGIRFDEIKDEIPGQSLQFNGHHYKVSADGLQNVKSIKKTLQKALSYEPANFLQLDNCFKALRSGAGDKKAIIEKALKPSPEEERQQALLSVAYNSYNLFALPRHLLEEKNIILTALNVKLFSDEEYQGENVEFIATCVKINGWVAIESSNWKNEFPTQATGEIYKIAVDYFVNRMFSILPKDEADKELEKLQRMNRITASLVFKRLNGLKEMLKGIQADGWTFFKYDDRFQENPTVELAAKDFFVKKLVSGTFEDSLRELAKLQENNPHFAKTIGLDVLKGRTMKKTPDVAFIFT